MEKPDNDVLSIDKLNYFLQQGLPTATSSSLLSSPSPPISNQESIYSGSPASTRDFYSPELLSVSEDEMFDFACETEGGAGPSGAGLDQPLFPTQSQDWSPLFNSVGNGTSSTSFQPYDDARRLSNQDQVASFVPHAPQPEQELDIGMSIQSFLENPPTFSSSTPISQRSSISQQPPSQVQDGALDGLATVFIREFARTRQGQSVSSLINALVGAGIKVSDETLREVLGKESRGQMMGNVENMGIYGESTSGPNWNVGPNFYDNMNQSNERSNYSPSNFSSTPPPNYLSIPNERQDQFSTKSRSSINSTTPSIVKKRGRKPSTESGTLSKCPHCSKSFSRAFNLKTHLETHVSVEERSKPFVCKVDSCQRGFSRKSDLKRHFKTVHADLNQEDLDEKPCV